MITMIEGVRLEQETRHLLNYLPDAVFIATFTSPQTLTISTYGDGDDLGKLIELVNQKTNIPKNEE